jgi:hypothetical protein
LARTKRACTARGHKGATIKRPGWAGEHIGYMPFPVERMRTRDLNKSLLSQAARREQFQALKKRRSYVGGR